MRSCQIYCACAQGPPNSRRSFRTKTGRHPCYAFRQVSRDVNKASPRLRPLNKPSSAKHFGFIGISSKNYLHRSECGAISTSWCRKSVYICQRDIISTKPDILVKDRGPPNLRRNYKNYLHRLECSAISIEVYVCQRDIISSKPDTLDRDRGPSNLRRISKNCLPRFNFDATSKSGYNTLKSITRRKNLISETLVEGYTSTFELRRRSAQSTIHSSNIPDTF